MEEEGWCTAHGDRVHQVRRGRYQAQAGERGRAACTGRFQADCGRSVRQAGAPQAGQPGGEDDGEIKPAPGVNPLGLFMCHISCHICVEKAVQCAYYMAHFV